MTALVFSFKNAAAGTSSHRSLQAFGTAIATATTATGWIVGTTASGRYSRMVSGSERLASTFSTTSTLASATAPTTTSAWRTESAYTGRFASGNWLINAQFRAVTSGVAQDGRVRIRVWAATSQDGQTGVRELTSGVLTGSTVTNLLTSANQTSAVTWSAPVIDLVNEYVFIDYEWEITGAGSGSTQDVDFRVGTADGCTITTPDFGSAAIYGNDQYVTSLLHFDGTNGSTTITESNLLGYAHTWTCRGTAALSTASKAFGTAALLCNSTSSVDTPSAFASPGADDFTIDCWCLTNLGTLQGLFGKGNAAFNDIEYFAYVDATGLFNAGIQNGAAGGGNVGIATVVPIIDGVWTHVAIERYGDDLNLFVNGFLGATTTGAAGTVHANSEILAVGALGALTSSRWLGFIDEFRLSLGIARYKGVNFLPPGGAYLPAWAFVATPIAPAVPTFGTPVISSVISFTATAIAPAVPTFGAPVAKDVAVFTATAIAPAVPTFGSPALIKVLSASALTVDVPTFGTPVVKDVAIFTATAIAPAVPTFGTPVAKDVAVFTATAIAPAVPTFGAPAIKDVAVFIATAIAPDAPIFGTPDQATYVIVSPASLIVDVPTLGAPLLGQQYVLVADALSVAPPELSLPAIGDAGGLIPLSLMVDAPTLDVPTLFLKSFLTASSLSVATPILSSFSFIQNIVLSPASLIVDVPTLPAPVAGVVHTLACSPLMPDVPAFGAPVLLPVVSLTASSLTVATPVISSFSFVQNFIISASGLTVDDPQLPTPVSGVVSVLICTPLTVAVPTFGTPVVGQKHKLIATVISPVTPVLGGPLLHQAHKEVALGLSVAVQASATPVIKQKHILTAAVIANAVPVLATPVLPLNRILAAAPLVVDPPILGSPLPIGGWPETYPIDSFTKLLLHGDGPDASTTIIDGSPSQHIVTPNLLRVSLSASLKKFGSAAISFAPGGFGLLETAHSADFEFGAGSFTIDWWEYRSQTKPGAAIIQRDDFGNADLNTWTLGFDDTEFVGVPGIARINIDTKFHIADNRSLGSIELNTWTHRAVVRDGDIFYAFKNGVLTDTWFSSTAISAATSSLIIGGSVDDDTDFIGLIDELRISKGVARWTTNFTPPSAAYKHFLDAVSPVLPEPTLANATLVRKSNFVAVALSVSAPTIASSFLNTGVVPVSLTVAVPTFGTSVLVSGKFTPIGISVSAPIFGTPAIVSGPFLAGLTLPAPVIGTPLMRVTVPSGFVDAVPTFGTPDLVATPVFVQEHNLTAIALTLPVPGIGSAAFTIRKPLPAASPLTATTAILDANPAFNTTLGVSNLDAVPVSVAVPILGAPGTGTEVNFTVASISLLPIISPAVLNPQMSPPDFVDGVPVLGTPTLKLKFSLAASPIVLSESLQRPVFGQNHKLTALSLITPVPLFGSSQLVVTSIGLALVGLTDGIPVFGAPVIRQTHKLASTELTVAALPLITPTLFIEGFFTSSSFVDGVPTFGIAALRQKHSFATSGLSVGVPTLGQPSTGQKHKLVASALSAPVPTLGTPILTPPGILIAAPIVLALPALGKPVFGRHLEISATALSSAIPIIGQGQFKQTYALDAEDLTVDLPTLGAPAIGQKHKLTALPLSVLPPAFGVVQFVQGHRFVSSAISVAVPVIGQPKFVQWVSMQGDALTVGSPDVGASLLRQIHKLSGINLLPVVIDVPEVPRGDFQETGTERNGTGALLDGHAVIIGIGATGRLQPVVGSGALVCGAATIAGVGHVIVDIELVGSVEFVINLTATAYETDIDLGALVESQINLEGVR